MGCVCDLQIKKKKETVGQSEKGSWDVYVSSKDHPWA
jgi:peroxiredoxin